MSPLMIVFVSLAGAVGYIFCGMMMFHYARAAHAWKRSDSYRQKKPDTSDWSAGSDVGFFLGLVWPLALLSRLAYRLAPTPQRMKLDEAQKKAKDQEEEIKRLTRINSEMDKILIRS